jgi:selenocysteine lyase/cysteine desulfurase
MANANLDAMYQEIILDHYKNPHHKGLREPFEAEVHHVNPTCGDEVTLRVHLAGTGENALIEDVSYDALGCSISQASVSGVSVLGPKDAHARGGAVSFELDQVHPHDVAQLLDSRGIAIRAGHHCTKPAHQRYGVQASVRASSYLYTTPEEIDALIEGLEYTKKYFRVD